MARRTAVHGLVLGGVLALWATAPLPAQHPPVVRGRVVQEGTGRPVAGARIRVMDGTVEALTSADGAFALRGLLPGRRTLRIDALGYASRTAEVRARNGRVTRVRLELAVLPLSLPGVEAVEPAAESPSSDAVVLDASEIRRSGAGDVGELLSTLPGVTVARRGGPGAPAGVSIRGSSPDQVLVLVDGIPVNSLLTGEADLSTIPTEGLRRVLVLRGGASSRYGGRALGGVVMVQSGPDGGEDLSLTGGAGSFGQRSGSLEASGDLGPGGEITGSVSASWSQSRGDFDYPRPPERGGGRTERENADARRSSLRAAVGWSPDHGPALRTRMEAVELRRGMPGPAAQPSATGRQEQARYGVAVSASGAGPGTDWRVSLQLQRQRARFRDPDPPLGPAVDGATRVNAAGLVATATSRRPGLRLEAGLEARRHWIRGGSLGPGAPSGQETLGAWSSLHLAGEPLEGWRLTGGPALRVDWSSRLRGPWASPRLGATLTRGPLAGHVAVSGSFSPPSLSDQFFQEGVLARPNPDLRPERVRPEIEAGVDVELGLGPVGVEVGVRGYAADVRGMIVWFPDHRFVWSPRNVDVTRRGGELRVRAGLPRRSLTLQAGLARSRVEYAGGVLDGQVVYRPALTADLALGWSPGPLEAGAEARYTGSRRTVAGSALNALDPFWIVDLSVARTFRPGGMPLRARIEIENAFDARGSILPDYPRPGRALALELRARPFDSPN